MKVLFNLLFVFILCVSLINCQEREFDDSKEVDDSEVLQIPPISTEPKANGENPITSITTLIRNNGTGLIGSIRDTIRNGWRRMKTHIQERYQKQIESLQKTAIDAMERLRGYVEGRIERSTDETTKQYLQSLNGRIQQVIDGLKNLMTNVETTVGDSKEQFRKLIPEYKIGDN